MKRTYRPQIHSGKTHLVLIGVLVVLLIVLAIRIATAPKPEETGTTNGPQASGGNKPAVESVVPTAGRANKRETIASQGDVKLDIKLLDEFSGGAIELGPSGEILYSESVLNPPKLDINLRKDKQNIRSFPLEEGAKMGFTSKGELTKKQGLLIQAEKRVPTPNINLSFVDGSYLNLVTEAKDGKPYYRLQRVNNGKAAKVYYESALPFDLLQRAADETFWIRERGEDRTSSLLCVDKDKQTRFKAPKDFDSVECVADTNGVVAATFSGSSTRQPYRAFILHGDTWTELPMPKEFVCSFVQCVTSDGLIFGLVADARAKAVKQIVWKDKAYTVLADIPGWPKDKELPILDKLSPSGMVLFADQKAQEGWRSYVYSIHPAASP